MHKDYQEKLPLLLCVLLVTIGAIANFVRFLWDIPISLGTFVLPGWTGGILFIMLGLLSAWAFKALARIPYSNRDP
jgi:hypothetical protein